MLFELPEIGEFDLSVEKVKIGQIFKISRGVVISKEQIENDKGEYPVYSSQTERNGELGRISTYMYDGKYLTWTTDGANAGKIFYRDGKFNITNVCGLLDLQDKEKYNLQYLYYMLDKVSQKYVNKGMGNAKLMSNVMSEIEIDVPKREMQDLIVSVLNSFKKYLDEIYGLLPQEIKKRQEQYNYYRDVLLNFEDKKAIQTAL